MTRASPTRSRPAGVLSVPSVSSVSSVSSVPDRPDGAPSARGRLVVFGLAGVLGLVAAAVLTVFLLAKPGGTLVAATPAQDTTMAAPPGQISLTFTADVTEAHIAVSGATTGAPVLAGRTVEQPVMFMAAGRHLVTYHVVTQTGGEIQGTVAFTVTSSHGSGSVPQPDVPQPDPTVLAYAGSTHNHLSPLDPVTATVLTANAVALLTIAALILRRRLRARP